MNCLPAAEERSRLENIVEEASGVCSEENSKNDLLTTCSDLVSADSDKCLTGSAKVKLNQHRTSDDEQLTQRVNNEYVCDMCNKVFTHRRYLMRHKKYGIPCGTNIKPYACDICGKACRNRAEVLVHMRTHTGERPFVCTVCGKAFMHQTELTNHCRTHSEVKGFHVRYVTRRTRDKLNTLGICVLTLVRNDVHVQCVTRRISAVAFSLFICVNTLMGSLMYE